MKYFCILEKQRFNHKTMTCIVMLDGSISRRQKDILQMQAEFNKRLHATDTDIMFTFSNQNHAKLTEEQKSKLESAISIDKLTVAVKGLKENKTPGCDGLSPELFQAVWDEIKGSLLEALKFFISN